MLVRQQIAAGLSLIFSSGGLSQQFESNIAVEIPFSTVILFKELKL